MKNLIRFISSFLYKPYVSLSYSIFKETEFIEMNVENSAGSTNSSKFGAKCFIVVRLLNSKLTKKISHTAAVSRPIFGLKLTDDQKDDKNKIYKKDLLQIGFNKVLHSFPKPT